MFSVVELRAAFEMVVDLITTVCHMAAYITPPTKKLAGSFYLPAKVKLLRYAGSCGFSDWALARADIAGCTKIDWCTIWYSWDLVAMPCSLRVVQTLQRVARMRLFHGCNWRIRKT